VYVPSVVVSLAVSSSANDYLKRLVAKVNIVNYAPNRDVTDSESESDTFFRNLTVT